MVDWMPRQHARARNKRLTNTNWWPVDSMDVVVLRIYRAPTSTIIIYCDEK